MKFTFQDEGGDLYDFEAPEGTDKNYVLQQASKQEGRKLKPFVADSKEGAKILERLLDGERSARGRSDADVTRLRARIEQLMGEHEGRGKELQTEREAARKHSMAKIEAVGEAREVAAKLYASEQTVASLRAALAKAEAKCASLAAELKAQAAIVPAKTGWRVHGIRRTEGGYMAGFEVDPK
jgi:chromosome segregation ATPase